MGYEIRVVLFAYTHHVHKLYTYSQWVRAGAEPAPQVGGGQIEKKKLGGPKLEKIINFGVKF
jgi:hypothetical protein